MKKLSLLSITFALLTIPLVAISTEEANALLQAGRYEEIAKALEHDRLNAAGPDLLKINRMLDGIGNLLPKSIEVEKSTGNPLISDRSTSTRANGLTPMKIISFGGGSKGWIAAVSPSTKFSEQKLITHNVWPAQKIKEGWDAKFRITGIAGDGKEWGVVMSLNKDGSSPGQTYWGPGIFGDDLETWIARERKSGKYISAVAGLGSTWVVVMTTDSYSKDQRYSRPGPFPTEWIKARAKDGYIITCVSGDKRLGLDNIPADTYFVVMTKLPSLSGMKWWARAPHKEFRIWLDEEKKTMAPGAFFGSRGQWGAVMVKGIDFSNWTYAIGASSLQIIDFANSKGIGETN